MTREYASPEQVAGKPLKRQTDIWSWGASLLEMFAGGLQWEYGPAVELSLDSYLENWSSGGGLPQMPPAVVAVLRKSFRPDTSDRWPTILAAANSLEAAYATAVARAYRRSRPPETVRRPESISPDGRAPDGQEFDDPRAWLAMALRADGRDPSEAESLAPRPAGSRKSQIVADLAVYDEAAGILGRLVAGGRRDLRGHLASACSGKAKLHEATHDYPGALALLDQAIDLWRELSAAGEPPESAEYLARNLLVKANLFDTCGGAARSIPLYDEALAALRTAVARRWTPEMAAEMANIEMNEAMAFVCLGEHQRAAALFQQSLQALERLIAEHGMKHLRLRLARCCGSLAACLESLGDSGGGSAQRDRASRIFRELVERERDYEHAADLAICERSRANVLRVQGNPSSAAGLLDAAIGTLETAIARSANAQLQPAMAGCCTDRANAALELQDIAGALRFLDKATALYEKLVASEGRNDFAFPLANCYMNKGNVLWQRDGDLKALPSYERAIEIFEHGAAHRDDAQCAAGLAKSLLNLGNALWCLNDGRRAKDCFRRSADIHWQMMREKGVQVWAGDWAWTELMWANLAARAGQRKAAAVRAQTALSVLIVEIGRTHRTDLQKVLGWAQEELVPLLALDIRRKPPADFYREPPVPKVSAPPAYASPLSPSPQTASPAPSRSDPEDRPKPDRLGVHLNVIHALIRDLKSHPRLREMFTVSVSEALWVWADRNNVRIEVGSGIELTEAQAQEFQQILNDTIRSNVERAS